MAVARARGSLPSKRHGFPQEKLIAWRGEGSDCGVVYSRPLARLDHGSFAEREDASSDALFRNTQGAKDQGERRPVQENRAGQVFALGNAS